MMICISAQKKLAEFGVTRKVRSIYGQECHKSFKAIELGWDRCDYVSLLIQAGGRSGSY